MIIEYSSEISANFYRTIRRQTPECSILNSHLFETLKSSTKVSDQMNNYQRPKDDPVFCS
jgi:hypothetical protein